eukprot:TRINITY_DN10441_c0_g1_i1.p1 TRINITY_DN10441_c0_g1~~TRINITY_DN10441_c0_g1_i1.p1  ORF type:complete len:1154 (-),score=213.22 TRINITY_DN10441_c0_g1_i1:159-3620(-)
MSQFLDPDLENLRIKLIKQIESLYGEQHRRNAFKFTIDPASLPAEPNQCCTVLSCIALLECTAVTAATSSWLCHCSDCTSTSVGIGLLSSYQYRGWSELQTIDSVGSLPTDSPLQCFVAVDRETFCRLWSSHAYILPASALQVSRYAASTLEAACRLHANRQSPDIRIVLRLVAQDPVALSVLVSAYVRIASVFVSIPERQAKIAPQLASLVEGISEQPPEWLNVAITQADETFEAFGPNPTWNTGQPQENEPAIPPAAEAELQQMAQRKLERTAVRKASRKAAKQAKIARARAAAEAAAVSVAPTALVPSEDHVVCSQDQSSSPLVSPAELQVQPTALAATASAPATTRIQSSESSTSTPSYLSISHDVLSAVPSDLYTIASKQVAVSPIPIQRDPLVSAVIGESVPSAISRNEETETVKVSEARRKRRERREAAVAAAELTAEAGERMLVSTAPLSHDYIVVGQVRLCDDATLRVASGGLYALRAPLLDRSDPIRYTLLPDLAGELPNPHLFDPRQLLQNRRAQSDIVLLVRLRDDGPIEIPAAPVEVPVTSFDPDANFDEGFRYSNRVLEEYAAQQGLEERERLEHKRLLENQLRDVIAADQEQLAPDREAAMAQLKIFGLIPDPFELLMQVHELRDDCVSEREMQFLLAALYTQPTDAALSATVAAKLNMLLLFDDMLDLCIRFYGQYVIAKACADHGSDSPAEAELLQCYRTITLRMICDVGLSEKQQLNHLRFLKANDVWMQGAVYFRAMLAGGYEPTMAVTQTESPLLRIMTHAHPFRQTAELHTVMNRTFDRDLTPDDLDALYKMATARCEAFYVEMCDSVALLQRLLNIMSVQSLRLLNILIASNAGHDTLLTIRPFPVEAIVFALQRHRSDATFSAALVTTIALACRQRGMLIPEISVRFVKLLCKFFRELSRCESKHHFNVPLHYFSCELLEDIMWQARAMHGDKFVFELLPPALATQRSIVDNYGGFWQATSLRALCSVYAPSGIRSSSNIDDRFDVLQLNRQSHSVWLAFLNRVSDVDLREYARVVDLAALLSECYTLLDRTQQRKAAEVCVRAFHNHYRDFFGGVHFMEWIVTLLAGDGLTCARGMAILTAMFCAYSVGELQELADSAGLLRALAAVLKRFPASESAVKLTMRHLAVFA